MAVSSIWTLLYPRGVLSIGRPAAPNHPWTADKLALSLLANQAPVTTKLLKTNNGHEILMIPGLALGVPIKVVCPAEIPTRRFRNDSRSYANYPRTTARH